MKRPENQNSTRVLPTLLLAGLTVLGCAVATAASAPASAPQVVNIALMNEPPQLNSTKATDQQSFFVLGHIMEGLTRTGKVTGEYQAGVAETWELGESGAVFHLRKNAVWADGKPVTAQDFVFSWRLVVDPKNASEYASLMYPVKNAEAINLGKAPVDSLGVVAVDDRTLRVTFEKPCGYFLGLTAHSVYFPIREEFYRRNPDKYAADAQFLMGNGPFMLTKWAHASSLTFQKNPSYWNARAIQLDRIEVPYITPEATALFNFFKDRKSDVIERMGKDDLPRAMSENYNMKAFDEGSVWYMTFNFREGRATRNVHLRRAIQLVYNPGEFIPKVVGIPGTKPATTYIPSWIKGVKSRFRQEFPYDAPRANLEEARREIELAKAELGGRIPPLTWLTGDTNFTAREAEYFQSILKQKLGLELRLDKQTFKQRLAKSAAGDFDICSEGWGPDYNDPMTFADLFASWNENNRGRYRNAEYDRLVKVAQGTADQPTRMRAMAEAERLALREVAVLPLYERVIIYMVQPYVKGVVRNPLGADPDFYFASIASPAGASAPSGRN